jgi:DNA-binding MarR family transcriptional regulator
MASNEQVGSLSRALLREGAGIGAQLAERTSEPTSDRRALRLLDSLSRQVLTAGRLAEELGLSPAATTALVDRLTAAGLVERVRDLPDRRQVRLQLTAQAQELGAQLLSPWGARIDAAAARLTRKEAEVVARFLGEVLGEHPG